MIWGLTLNPGELHTEVVGSEVHLSMAALESRTDLGAEYNGYTQVVLRTESSEHLLCTLVHGIIFQQNLDLRLREGERISVFIQGKNKVHLTGYSGWSLSERSRSPSPSPISVPQTVPPIQHHLDERVFSPPTNPPQVKMEFPDNDIFDRWSRQSLIANRQEAEVKEALLFHERLRQKLGTNYRKHPATSRPEDILNPHHYPVLRPSESPDAQMHQAPTAEDPRMNGPYFMSSHLPLNPMCPAVNIVPDSAPCNLENPMMERQIKRVRNKRRKSEKITTATEPPNEQPNETAALKESPCSNGHPADSDGNSSNDSADNTDSPPKAAPKEPTHDGQQYPENAIDLTNNDGDNTNLESPTEGIVKQEVTEQSQQLSRGESECSPPPPLPVASSHRSSPGPPVNKLLPSFVLSGLPLPPSSLLWGQQALPFGNTAGKVNGQKAFACQYCGKLFSQASNLRTHQLIHSDNKPYKCKFCGVGFKQAGNLKAHERIHTGIKPFKCQYCPKQFSRSTTRRVHERLHTGQTPFKCKYCSKRFYQSSNLKNHERSHEGLPPERMSPD